MSKMKRKDKTRKPNNQHIQEDANGKELSEYGLGKNILLLVEGETEEVYFEGIKNNSWLRNNLAGIDIEKVGNLGKAKERVKEEYKNSKYGKIWVISDNDKRNAFVLEEKDMLFLETIPDESHLPKHILEKLKRAYQSEINRYFLSIYDYFQWLKTVITADEIVEYWDVLQHYTPHKNRELADFDENYQVQYKEKVSLAYSCIAFEFWLILHFEVNMTPFLWVEHDKGGHINAFDHLKTLVPHYVKGKAEKKTVASCSAYEILLEDYTKNIQTRDDEWNVIIRLVKAYQNTVWLQKEMKPVLKRQSGKWYEVNPYVLGTNDLIADLLNLKKIETPIDYFGLQLKFAFDAGNKQVSLWVENKEDDTIIINQTHHASFFKIRIGNYEYMPQLKTFLQLDGKGRSGSIDLFYHYQVEEDIPLVLVFNDFRSRSKSTQLLVLLA